MHNVRAGLTYEDYDALPEGDGRRYEIHDGELSVSPSPTFRHQLIIARLLGFLRAHVLARKRPLTARSTGRARCASPCACRRSTA